MKQRYLASILLIVGVVFLSACARQQPAEDETQTEIKQTAREYMADLLVDPEFCSSLSLTDCRTPGTKNIINQIAPTSLTKVTDTPETYDLSFSQPLKGTDSDGRSTKIRKEVVVTVIRSEDGDGWQVEGYQLGNTTPYGFGVQFITWFVIANFAWFFSVPLFLWLIGSIYSEDYSGLGCYYQISLISGMVLGGLGAIYESFISPIIAFILGFIAYPIVMFILAFLVAIIFRFFAALFRPKKKRRAIAPKQNEIDYGKMEETLKQASDDQLISLFEMAKDKTPALAYMVGLEMQRRGMRVPGL